MQRRPNVFADEFSLERGNLRAEPAAGEDPADRLILSFDGADAKEEGPAQVVKEEGPPR